VASYIGKTRLTSHSTGAGLTNMASDNPNEQKTEVEDITLVLKEILNELKEINVSLKSIARSQAHQSTVQRSFLEKNRK
jgi:hypothetical protein